MNIIKSVLVTWVLLSFTPLQAKEEVGGEHVLSGLTKDDDAPGVRQYLVYFKDKGSDAAKWLSLWSRSMNLV